jgi:hypothetical protein
MTIIVKITNTEAEGRDCKVVVKTINAEAGSLMHESELAEQEDATYTIYAGVHLEIIPKYTKPASDFPHLYE